jgi:hypothetical protein
VTPFTRIVRRSVQTFAKLRPTITVGILLAVVAGLTVGCSFVEKQRHVALLNRIEVHVETAMADSRGAKSNPTPFLKLDDVNARWEVLRAIKTALLNEFWYPEKVSRPKLLAVVERLDATKGRDFDTVQGCLTIMDMLEDATPTARDYAWFATIHEAQESGHFPKLVRRTPPPST